MRGVERLADAAQIVRAVVDGIQPVLASGTNRMDEAVHLRTRRPPVAPHERISTLPVKTLRFLPHELCSFVSTRPGRWRILCLHGRFDRLLVGSDFLGTRRSPATAGDDDGENRGKGRAQSRGGTVQMSHVSRHCNCSAPGTRSTTLTPWSSTASVL